MKHYYCHFLFVLAALQQCAAGDSGSNIWGPTSNNIAMSIVVKAKDESFLPRDIKSAALIERLRGQSNAISRYLWQSFSNEEQSVLTNYYSSATNARRAEDVLCQMLNGIVAGPYFYSSDRFNGVDVSSEARAPAAGFWPSSGDLPRLNRMLLQEAFPVEISASLKAGDMKIKLKEPLVLRIVFRNSSTNETFYMDLRTLSVEDDEFYSISVISPSGSQRMLKAPPILSGSGGVYDLPSNQESMAFTLRVSRIYQFDEIGHYTIVVQRAAKWPGEKQEPFKIVSNPLTIEVVP